MNTTNPINNDSSAKRAMAKLSPYTLSLIGSSPPSLPHVPTLKELRDRAADRNGEAAEPKPIPTLGEMQRLPSYSFSSSPPPQYSSRSSRASWAKVSMPGKGANADKPSMKSSMAYASDVKGELPLLPLSLIGLILTGSQGTQPTIGDIEPSNSPARTSWISW